MKYPPQENPTSCIYLRKNHLNPHMQDHISNHLHVVLHPHPLQSSLSMLSHLVCHVAHMVSLVNEQSLKTYILMEDVSTKYNILPLLYVCITHVWISLLSMMISQPNSCLILKLTKIPLELYILYVIKEPIILVPNMVIMIPINPLPSYNSLSPLYTPLKRSIMLMLILSLHLNSQPLSIIIGPQWSFPCIDPNPLAHFTLLYSVRNHRHEP